MGELLGGPEQTDEEFEAEIERVREYKRANPQDRYVCFLLGSRSEDAKLDQSNPPIKAYVVGFGPPRPRLALVRSSNPDPEGLDHSSEPPATDPEL